MAAYDNYLAGKLVDVALDEDEIDSRAARDRRSAGTRVELRAPAEPPASYGRLMLVIVNGSFGVPPPSLSSCPLRTSSLEPLWSSP